MRIACAVALAILVVGVSAAEEKKAELSTDKEKENYSVGYQFGAGLKTLPEPDMDMALIGIKDAFEGREPKLTPDEMKKVMKALRQKAATERQRQFDEQAQKNYKEGEAFLAENKKREGVKTTDSGLQYKVIKEGDGPTPKATDSVKVNYRGTLIDGTEFDNSYARGKPETFNVDGIIKGWTEALQMMKVGSKWQLFVHPDLAYGRRGLGRIPPDSTLIFEIELLQISKEEAPAAAEPPQPSGTKE